MVQSPPRRILPCEALAEGQLQLPRSERAVRTAGLRRYSRLLEEDDCPAQIKRDLGRGQIPRGTRRQVGLRIPARVERSKTSVGLQYERQIGEAPQIRRKLHRNRGFQLHRQLLHYFATLRIPSAGDGQGSPITKNARKSVLLIRKFTPVL